MRETYVFPSVLEESNIDLPNVTDTFLDGMRLVDEGGRSYILGNLSLAEGSSPHKLLNSSARDLDYRLLSMAAMILASKGKTVNLNITTGFPFVTYQSYNAEAKEFYSGSHRITVDTSTYGGQGVEVVNINVNNVSVITEIEGCVKAIKEGSTRESDNFFVVNLGFGTFEGAIATRRGIINRSTFTAKGIAYAVNNLERELLKKYPLSIFTEQQIDRAFQRGSIVVDRQRIDITDIRSSVLKTYYNEVISPAMRKKFSNEDFLETTKIYLAGGGAQYQEIVELFRQEFSGVLDVIVYPDPHLCAGTGYCLHAMGGSNSGINVDPTHKSISVGIDLGNSNTVVVVESRD